MDFGTPDKQTEASLHAEDPRARIDAMREDRNRELKLLIAAAAQGDVQAFETLYNGTAAWLLGRVRRITGEDHAEDVLAEVFLQVWRSLADYDQARGEPLAWLATIARSRALDRLRTERRSHGGQAEAPASDAFEASHDCGPEQLLAVAERDKLLKVSMGILSPREQLVLGMAYFRDCTQSEIASLTGFPLGSVKTLLSRSQRKLRDSITRSTQIALGLPYDNRSTPET